MFPAEGAVFLDHLPSGGKNAFGADSLPEVEVESAVILLTVTEDAGHDDGPNVHAGLIVPRARGWHWFQLVRRATLGGP
jgi:hypothetical protein